MNKLKWIINWFLLIGITIAVYSLSQLIDSLFTSLLNTKAHYIESFESVGNWKLEADTIQNEIEIISGEQPYTVNLATKSLSNDVTFYYTPIQLGSEEYKILARVTLTDSNNKSPILLTYILSGDNDFGMPQNVISDGKLFLTKKIFVGQETRSQVVLNIGNDLQEGIDRHKFSFPQNVSKIQIEFSAASVTNEKIKAKVSRLEKISEGYEASSMKVFSPDINFTDPDKVASSVLYYPTNGQSLMKACSSPNEKVALTDTISLPDLGYYFVAVDIRTINGVDPVAVVIDNGRTKWQIRPNKFQSQGNWLRVGKLFSNAEGKVQISIINENKSNNIDSNCYLADNLQIYKIPLLFWLTKRDGFLDQLNLNKSHYNPGDAYYFRRLDYSTLLKEDELKALNLQYESLGLPIYYLSFDEDSFLTKNSLEDFTKGTLEYRGEKYKVDIRMRGDGFSHWVGPAKSLRINFSRDAFYGKKSINLIVAKMRGYTGELFSSHMANKLGLTHLDNKNVFVVVNGRPYGLMFEIEQWSADILEKNKYQTGDLFRENNIENDLRAPFEKGYNTDTFFSHHARSPLEWRKLEEDAENPNDFTSIFALTELLNLDRVDLFSKIVDIGEFAKYDTLSILTGSGHQDSVHNARLYFDPTRGFFVPLPADTGLNMNVLDPSVNIGLKNYNPFIDLIFKNAYAFQERNTTLWEYLSGDSLADDKKFLAQEEGKAILASKLAPFFLDYEGKKIGFIDDIAPQITKHVSQIGSFREKLMSNFKTPSYIEGKLSNDKDATVATLQLTHSASSLDFQNSLLSNLRYESASFTLFIDNGNGFLDGSDIVVDNSNRDHIQIPSYFHYKTYIEKAPMVLSESEYANIMGSTIQDSDKQDIRNVYKRMTTKPLYLINTDPKAENRINYFKKLGVIPPYLGLTLHLKFDHNINLENLKKGLIIEISDPYSKKNIQTEISFGPVVSKPENLLKRDNVKLNEWFKQVYDGLDKKTQENIALDDLVMIGEISLSPDEFYEKHNDILTRNTNIPNTYSFNKKDIKLEKNFIIPPNTTLVINPGSKISLGRDVSIISLGTIVAIGDDRNPIVFQGQSNNRGWGVLALLRDTARGKFTNCIFDGGGSARILGMNFTGTLSAYHANLELENCTIKNTSLTKGDDAVNLKYATGVLKSNKFEKIGSDAIDFDFANADSIIQNNQFVDIGGDAIDFSGTVGILVADNKIWDVGDKGISVGEKSNITLINNDIKKAHTGISSKDSSIVFCESGKIIESIIGFSAYNKKYIFGGGKLFNKGCVLEKNNNNYGQEIFKDTDKRYRNDDFVSKIVDYSVIAENNGNVFREYISTEISIKSKKNFLLKYLEGGPEATGIKVAYLKNTCTK